MKKRYIVSGCLLGERCKYNGESNFNVKLDFLRKLGCVVGVCPEVLGGLSTPRAPSEIVNNKVINNKNEDVTNYFINGANETLKIANKFNINKAILKSNSPSCGEGYIYDGSFTHTLIKGDGMTARLLKENNIEIYTEKTEPIYDAIIVCSGTSKRSSLPYNKVLEPCRDKLCIESSVEPFLTDYLCNKIIIVCNKEEAGLLFMESATFNPLCLIGLFFMIIGPVLEIISDYQVHKFINDNNDHTKVCNYGLWNYSRHPNYLGEICMWFSIGLLCMSSINGGSILLLIGAVLNLMLFLFISIPMAENHQKSRKLGFDEYKKETRMLLPIYKRSK